MSFEKFVDAIDAVNERLVVFYPKTILVECVIFVNKDAITTMLLQKLNPLHLK